MKTITASPPEPMTQPLLLPHWARIREITPETEGIATFTLEFEDAAVASSYRFEPGQFNMIYVPGYGEAALSMSSDPGEPGRVGHTVHFVGNVTRAMSRMKVGDRLGVRGPFGRGWPTQDQNGAEIVLVAGGIGLAPLRPVLYHLLDHRNDYGRIALLYGARTPGDLLFADEFESWREGGIDVLVTVDRADESWDGLVGVVPVLFYRLRLQKANCIVFTCGPEIMMRFVVYEGLARRIPKDRIYLSMERNMKCGQGLCGRCQLGPQFVCTDGPVFTYAALEPYLSAEDF